MHTQAFIYIPLSFLEALANYGGKPVILPAEEQYGHFFPVLDSLNNRVPVDTAREFLWVFGWRVIEQRFPRHAYVIIADQKLDMDSRARLEHVFFTNPESLKQFLSAGPENVSRLPPIINRGRRIGSKNVLSHEPDK